MRRWVRWWSVVLALVALVIAAPFVVLNTGAGQRWVAGLAGPLTGGMVRVEGLSGRFPDALRIAHLQLADARGVWLEADGLALDWSPLALLHGDAKIDWLSARRIAVRRRPVPAAGAQTSGASMRLPVSVEVERLRVERLELGKAVAGQAAVLSLEGTARLASLHRGSGRLAIRRLDAPGDYTVDGRVDRDGLKLTVAAHEPADGLAAALAGLPDLVPAGARLALDLSLAGPWRDAGLKARFSAGPMQLAANGTLDLVDRRARLALDATAPAMRPRPDLSWGSIAIHARVHGTLAAPVATAKVDIDRLSGFGVELAALSADLSAKDGKLALRATASGLHAPGVGGLFAVAPLRLAVDTTTAARRIAFTLSHPRLAAHGTLVPAGVSTVALDVPDVAPFAALAGQTLAGSVAAHAKITLKPEMTVDATAKLALTGGRAPAPALIGPDGRLVLKARRDGDDIVLSRLALDGAKLHLTATGGLKRRQLALDWKLGLPDLSVLARQIAGTLAAHGRVSGPLGDLAATARLDGRVAVAGGTASPVHATLAATGLPGKPAGRIEAGGVLDGAPLALLATAARDAQGGLRLDISKADWKSGHVEAALALAPGAVLPQGRVALSMRKLSDLDHLMGGRLSGSLTAAATFDADAVRLKLDGTGLGGAGGGVAKVALAGTLHDPLGRRVSDATLAISGLRARGIGGRAKLVVKGPPEALGLDLSADLTGVAGAALTARAAAVVDAAAQRAEVSRLDVDWRDQHLRLARRLRVAFGGGVTLDDLALRLGAARLDLRGRVAPALDLKVALRDLPASLAKLAAPSLALAGTLSGDAVLKGAPARPRGSVRLRARGLRMTTGPAQTLKPAEIDARVTLAGSTAKLDVKAQSGRDRLTLAGTAPLGAAGALALRVGGRIDLSALNAVLAAEGRRVAGQLTLDARIGGTIAAPAVSGSVRLAGGDVQDIPLGLRLADISAELKGDGQTVRLVRLSARAGPGTISADGTLSLAGAMPVSLHLRAKNAQLLASELIHGTLGADLTLSGAFKTAMKLAGEVTIGRTDIQVPGSLPAGVATLNVRRPGEKPAPRAASGPAGPVIALDVRVHAPGEVFVRGRGLDVELYGDLHIVGTTADPRPHGQFSLRRGSFTLAGKTLQFDKGTLGFDGGLPIDPTLDFVATTGGSDVTMTISVTGYASKPKITLSSSPELPQDEILARLLFDKHAIDLGPVELAQMAQALAQLTGGGGGFSPLDKLRAGLGLDRLSVNGGNAAGGPTVEAGKTIAPGVYLGARQSATGSGTKAVLEVDLGHGLKLQAGVGAGGDQNATGASGGSGNDVGITYQFDY